MKTTIELPDELLIEAKKIAAEERSSLKKLVEMSLRKELDQRKKWRSRRDRRIRWVTVSDEPPRDLDVADREAVHEWLGRLS
jgi:metal-responsive CopG/Arc/MetJ family transcriptional regulator